MEQLPFSGATLHDAAIVAVSHRPPGTLALDAVLADGRQVEIEFSAVGGWGLAPFEMQNVILDVYVWTSETPGSRDRCDELEVPESARDLVLAGQMSLFELDPSTGMGGFVVAKDVAVKPR